MRRLQLFSLLGLILLLLTACSQPEFVSEQPTNYSRAVADSPGRLKIYYLKAEHPDVQLIIPLIEDFLSIDQTQDYRNPDWSQAAFFTTAELIASRRTRESHTLTEHEIIKHMHNCQVQRIVFMGNLASVTAEVQVIFTNVDARYAGWYHIALNEPTSVEATLDLIKEADSWLIRATRYSYLSP